MQEPTTTSISQPAEALSYKPVSGWAIVGLVLGIGITSTVVFSFFYGLSTNNPLWLSPLTMFVAVAGVTASLLGLRQIAVSEGTRVGKGVALWGLWLSVVSALGYSAYYGFTYLALVRQANAFVMVKDADDDLGSKPNSGFLTRLKEGALDPTQHYSAFLLILEPAKRKTSDPRNEDIMRKTHDVPGPNSAGLLTRFREVKLVKLIRDAVIQAKETGGEITFEPLDVLKWDREPNGAYIVVRDYKIKSPELTALVALTVYSKDIPGEPRRWVANVLPGQSDPVKIVDAEYTPLGTSIRKLQESAFESLTRWKKNLPAGPLSVPNNTDSAKIPRQIQGKVNQLFQQGEAGGTLFFEAPSTATARWKRVGDKFQFLYPAKLPIPGDQPLDGLVTVESLTPVDPHTYNDATLDWKVVSFEWLLGK